MQYKNEEVTEGLLNGKKVWICDYRFNDMSEKAIRHIKPTLVLVRDNSETKKRIYDSCSHFVAINSKGKPLETRVITPFDNTRSRWSTGIMVRVFDNEKECKEEYVRMCRVIAADFQRWIEAQTAYVNIFLNKINKEISDNTPDEEI